MPIDVFISGYWELNFLKFYGKEFSKWIYSLIILHTLRIIPLITDQVKGYIEKKTAVTSNIIGVHEEETSIWINIQWSNRNAGFETYPWWNSIGDVGPIRILIVAILKLKSMIKNFDCWIKNSFSLEKVHLLEIFNLPVW